MSDAHSRDDIRIAALNLPSQERNSALLRRHGAADGLEDSGLAGPVRAEQRDDFPLLYFKTDAPNGDNRPIVRLDIFHLE